MQKNGWMFSKWINQIQKESKEKLSVKVKKSDKIFFFTKENIFQLLHFRSQPQGGALIFSFLPAFVRSRLLWPQKKDLYLDP